MINKPNKRVTLQKASPTAKNNTKQVKESYDMNEDEDLELDAVDETEEETDLGDLGDDFSGEDETTDETEGMEDEFDSLTPSQAETFDDEIDSLLGSNFEDEEGTEMLEEDDEFSMGGTDEDNLSIEDDEFSETEDEDFSDEDGLTDFLTADELEAIIDSPDSFHALEDSLIDKIQGEEEEEEEETDEYVDSDLDGISDEDQQLIESVINEEVSLATSLKDIDFELENDSVLGGKKTIVSKGKGTLKGGAEQEAPKALQKTMQQESIKKSKMLVEAAKEIKKVKTTLNEASKVILSQKKEVARLKFENAKLLRVNGILTAVGENLSKEVSKQIVEGFKKCQTNEQVTKLYEKVVAVIKSKLKPGLNETVKKQTVSAKALNENSNGKKQEETQKKQLNKEQIRRNFLMGITSEHDGYYKN